MRQPIEIIREILENCEGTETQDEVRANTHIATTLGEIESACKQYAKEVIDDILSRSAMIYVDNGEAVYDYEKFGEFVKEHLL